MRDLFGALDPLPGEIAGRQVLDRRSSATCCDGLLTVGSSKAMHEASLRCTGCGAFRGWLSGLAALDLRARSVEGSLPDLPVLSSDGRIADPRRWFRRGA